MEHKKPEVEIVKPIPNTDAWGLGDHEMPAAPSDAEQQLIDDAIGEMTTSSPTKAAPEISQGSEVDFSS